MTETRLPLSGTALRLATALYRATPFRPLRAAYFQTFLRLVRGRRVLRRVEGVLFELELGQVIDVGVLLQQYERDVVAILEEITRTGWTALDVGANIGAHALRLTKLVGPSGRVHAFEPMDFAYAKLRRNAALNRLPNLEIHQLALSDENRPQQEVRFRSSWASSGRRTDESTTVEMRRLDDWCADRGNPPVHLVKIDVDGHEYQVLAGATRTIERCRPAILIEAGAWHFSSAHNPLQWLASHGYRFWDTSTRAELDLSAIRARLPERDEDMAVSMNLLAGVAPLLAERHRSGAR